MIDETGAQAEVAGRPPADEVAYWRARCSLYEDALMSVESAVAAARRAFEELAPARSVD